ncbi:hypothetical protein OB955_22290 [Halobacteria archaeon AArc-m2/3/4]|uniref:OB-fold nucleic acid binding domain-containing protein n=1 Tax=Natronoglomus mannanivorans TaxID=2979990 RepID=A0ABT2QKF3_9EURY|nr:hypothetical protein [Halobacteria archaeon AArc-m2/3/4]
MQEPYGQHGRLLAGVLLVGLLAGCLVWAGTMSDDPLSSQYPDEVEVTPSSEAYVGEQVRLGGFVVDTDPVVIATLASGHGRFTLVDANDHLLNSDRPLERDDRVTAVGRLEDDSTLAVERVMTGDSADTRSMIVISLVGGLWVAGRFVRGWRFDSESRAFVPRETRLTVGGVLGKRPTNGRDRRSRPESDHQSDSGSTGEDHTRTRTRTAANGGNRRA